MFLKSVPHLRSSQRQLAIRETPQLIPMISRGIQWRGLEVSDDSPEYALIPRW